MWDLPPLRQMARVSNLFKMEPINDSGLPFFLFICKDKRAG